VQIAGYGATNAVPESAVMCDRALNIGGFSRSGRL